MNALSAIILGIAICSAATTLGNSIDSYSEHRLMEHGFEKVCGEHWYSGCEWKKP